MAHKTDSTKLQLKEFEPLTSLLEMLPCRVHKAFMTYDAEWTCLDVTTQYIAVGTTIGIVFLVDRITQKLQKLVCKGGNIPVSKVRIGHSVDHMVAIGTTTGNVFIFQLPSILPGRNKQLHLYEVIDLHHSTVTSLVWSPNCQKLYTGDEDGVVNCTEFEYDKEFYARCQSYFILKEPNEIVQLDYCSKILLVSTRWRTVVYMSKEKRVLQIGKKDRKILGKFGAVFAYGTSFQPQDICLLAARPGYRLWKATTDGTVQTTFMFKDLITKTTEGLDLLDDTVNLHDVKPHKIEDCQFGPLLVYQDSYLVTFHESGLFVIDPANSKFVGYHTNIGPIVDVSINKDEIYLLRSGYGRKIVRISQTPYLITDNPIFEDRTIYTNNGSDNNSNPDSKKKFLGAFKEVSERIHGAIEGHIIPIQTVNPPWGYAKGTEDDLPSPADSAKETTTSSAGTPDSPSAPVMFKRVSNIGINAPSKDDEFNGSGVFREIAPGGPVWEEPLEILHPGAPPLVQGKTSIKTPHIVNKKMIDEQMNRWNAVTNEDADEIVFAAPKQKKKIKKKGKEKDTSSIASNELQVSSATGSLSSRSSSPLPSSMSEADSNVKNNMTVSNEHSKIDLQNKLDELDIINKSDDEIGASLDKVDDVSTQKSQEEVEEMRKRLESELTALPVSDNESEIINQEQTEIILNKIVVSQTTEDTPQNHLITDKKDIKLSDDRNIDQPEIEEKQNIKVLDDEAPKCDDKNSDKNYHSMQVSPGVDKSDKTSISKEKPQHTGENHDNIKKITTSGHLSIVSMVKEELADLSMNTDSINKAKCDVKTPEESKTANLPTNDSLESVDDIYSIYACGSSSSRSSGTSRSRLDSTEGKSIDDILNAETIQTNKVSADQQSEKKESYGEESGEVVPVTSIRPEGFMDAWTEFLVPGNVQCLCVTERHIWVVDKSDKVYWSFLSGPGIKWHKVETTAQQISVSPSGAIVWRICNGVLYAGTKITTRAPAGLKWEDFVLRDVVSISVDDTTGWYVKNNGEVIMHKKLTRERPCFKPIRVPCESEIIQISCRGNVVWALTIDRAILVRNGITTGVEEGTDWSFLEGAGLGMLVSSCDLGWDNTAWIIDVVGRVWFTTDVDVSSPQGSGLWWQLNYGFHRDPRHPDSQEVSLAEYLMQDSSAFDTIKSIATNPKKLVKMVKQNDKGGLISSRCNGLWVCPCFKNSIHVCRGSMLGHRWERLELPGIVSSVNKWLHISVGGLQVKSGLIWAQQPSGDLFYFNPYARRHTSIQVYEVSPPEANSGKPFKCLCVLPNVVWALMPNGKVYLRTDMRPTCPQGISWVNLNMQQLGNVKISWLSAGSQNVWALDTGGQIYLRIGIDPPSKQLLNPAWVPVEGTPHTLGAKFTKVFAGTNDWMVWALDSYGSVYTRKGITDSMPIGTHWVTVNGPKAEYLCVGEKHVYALTNQREILVREGIEIDNLKGEYWNKIPGSLDTISVTKENDELWGINKDGQLCQRFTHSLKRKSVLDNLQGEVLKGHDVEGGWELL